MPSMVSARITRPRAEAATSPVRRISQPADSPPAIAPTPWMVTNTPAYVAGLSKASSSA